MANYCFDLDGTLINSINGIYESLVHSLKKNNLKIFPKNKLKKYIGPPLSSYIEKLISGNLGNQIKKNIIKDFRIHHDNEGYKFYELYPYTLKVLKKIKYKKNNKLFIVTNKPFNVTINSLKKFDIYNFFDDIFAIDNSTDNLKIIPNDFERRKNNYLKLIEKFYEDKNNFFIGDTESDYEATSNNAFKFIFVEYGYGSLQISNSTFQTIKNLLELENLI